MIPGGVNELLLRSAGAAGPTAGRSVRFNSADSAYLSRTPASAGNRKTWTWSGWMKRSNPSPSNSETVFTATSGGLSTTCEVTASGNIEIYTYSSGYVYRKISTAVFRDFSAWYHFQLVYDTSNSTAEDRVRFYVNGNRITTWSTNTNPSLDYEGLVNQSGTPLRMGGGVGTGGYYFTGYLALVHFIDGQALTPSSFGETSATTGQWIAKDFSGTYGTNGFFLDFLDNSTAAALGYDAAGSNDWTVNNLSVSNGVSTIASATGALPILNTDSTGATVQSGVRSDSNASFIRLAVACGTASGLDLTDQNVSGRSASNATITNSGVTGTTSSSKFYSGSANVTNGNYFKVAAHGDFEIGGTWTIEFWAKPDSNATGPEKTIIGYGVNNTDGYVIMVGRGGATFRTNGTSDLVYDGSITDWTHFAFVASGGTTKRIFVNGNLVASGSGTINASGSYDTYIGSPNTFNSGFRFTGEFQDVRIYKGKAKYTASFTAPNTYYPSLAAGNDSLRDHPTSAGTSTGAGGEVSGNYATLNPLDTGSLAVASSSLANGNLDFTADTGSQNYTGYLGTIAFASGKIYCEFTIGAGDVQYGIIQESAKYSVTGGYGFATATNARIKAANGRIYYGSSSPVTGLQTHTTGDVVMLAVDLDAGKFWSGKNGTWDSSGNPATGSNATTSFTTGSSPWHICVQSYSSGKATLNAGQRAFAYTAPSGFSPLVDTLLPTPTIAKPNTVMDVATWTGSGASKTITLPGAFNPDLVWIKARSIGYAHALFDVIRGGRKILISNSTAAEDDLTAYSSGITSFNSDGFTLDSDGAGYTNESTRTYVGWCWDAGSSNATNTSGTITSTCRTNISAGFSVVSYTGNGTAGATVGHSLGVGPEFIVVKRRDSTGNWGVYTRQTGSANILFLNTTDAESSSTGFWNATSPTSTVFSLGTQSAVNANGGTYVAYCWAPVAGYSAFGSYTGNGSSDGPFVYTGFRPRWIMLKNASNGGTNFEWFIYDTQRNPYNVGTQFLIANGSQQENYTTYGLYNDQYIDILSNGFKIRTSYQSNNNGTVIYAAFAEAPFPYARAR